MMSKLLNMSVAITLLLALVASGVYADDGEWLRLGVSDDGNFILHIDQKSVKKASDREVFVRVKRELSEEGQNKYRQWFYEEKKRAEKEVGSTIDGDPEELLKLLIKSETHEAFYFFDCEGEEYRVQELRQYSAIKLVRVHTIQKGSTEEKIKSILCHSK